MEQDRIHKTQTFKFCQEKSWKYNSSLQSASFMSNFSYRRLTRRITHPNCGKWSCTSSRDTWAYCNDIGDGKNLKARRDLSLWRCGIFLQTGRRSELISGKSPKGLLGTCRSKERDPNTIKGFVTEMNGSNDSTKTWIVITLVILTNTKWCLQKIQNPTAIMSNKVVSRRTRNHSETSGSELQAGYCMPTFARNFCYVQER